MKRNYTQILSVLVILLTIFYSFYSLMPQGTTSKSFEKNFSIEKALTHLKEISKEPHYVGAENHKFVRDYIVKELEKLGLTVELQKANTLNKEWKSGCKITNIITKIKGTEKGKALLLLTHYDSSPHSSLGASDAGSGVVTILEGIRAFLSENPQPKNDIIICITDAEELGLLGAKAFVNKHPWAKEVGMALNFESRGTGGASYTLLETNGGNQKMIEAFQKAKPPYPVATSLMYSIYKMLPNDTDLTVFREEGNIDGFNFAFIDDHYDYHTQQDSYERIDLNTLQHQATYLMSLLSYFSENNTELKATEDYVYFNVPLIGLIYYPFSWAIPMVVISGLVFLVLLFFGFSRRKLTLKGVLSGFAPLFLSLIVARLLSLYGWKALLKIYPQYNDILHGFTYNGHVYILAFLSITISFCFFFYKKYFKKYNTQDLLIAPTLLWLLLNIGIALYLTGGAYFIIPLFTMLISLALFIFSDKQQTIWINTLLSIPTLIIITPWTQMLPVGLGLKMLIGATILTILLFVFLIPVLGQYTERLHLTKRFFIFGGIALFIGHFNSDYNTENRKPNSILYILDKETNKAYWASYDLTTDSFTKQFLGEKPEEGNLLENTIASKYKTTIRKYTNAPIKNIAPPVVTVTSDTIINDRRKVQLTIESKRNANRIELLSKSKIPFYTFGANGAYAKSKSNISYLSSAGSVLTYFLTEPNEKLVIDFSVPKKEKLSFTILEAKYDLFTNPIFNITPRTNEMIPTPFVLNDASVVKVGIDL